MNRYYSYPNINMWQSEPWEEKCSPVYRLIEYIQNHDEIVDVDYTPSYEIADPEDLTHHPLYRLKTHGIDDPAVLQELHDKGLYYICTGQGGKHGLNEHCWIGICPQRSLDQMEKLPTLIIFDKEDESSPLWTMRALTKYRAVVDLLSETMDFLLVIIVNQFIDKGKTYFGILQEISTLLPCDINRLYVDVRKALAAGKISDIPGFRLVNYTGVDRDVEEAVELFSTLEIPVINIAGCWGNGDSLTRGLIMTYDMNKDWFNRDWLIHTRCGKELMESVMLEYRYDYVEDPALTAEMEQKGLIYRIGYNQFNERYIIALPRQAAEEGTALPVVLVFQEVYAGNEHLAVTANSYCGEWLEIAAQGECAVIFYVLEDIVSNDRAIGVVQECAEEFRLDLTRLYVTGHSHDGYFAYAFASRNPDFVTALSNMGMETCPVGMNDVQDYTKDHEIRNYDIPTINLMGLCESRFPENEEEKRGYWADRWNHVCRNFHIRERSREEILAAFESDNRAERITGIPGDECRTVWADGNEHYIIDFVNLEGKRHLEVVRSENIPHMIIPFHCDLSWNFFRRFRRNPETKEIEEWYQ